MYCIYEEIIICNKRLPVLSAQLITAPTGRPREILNLAPAEPPRPRNTKLVVNVYSQYINEL